MMKLRFCLLPILVAASGQAALAQTGASDQTSVQVTPGQALFTSKMHAEATVTKIDYKTREVGLRTQSGEETTLVASAEVKKLDMVKVGDKVVADYEELMRVKLLKDSKQPIGWHSTDASERAPAGSAPAGKATATKVLVANITNVDPTASTVTLQGAQESKVVSVKDPSQLKLMKVGDQVEVTITQTLALAVEPVSAKN